MQDPRLPQNVSQIPHFSQHHPSSSHQEKHFVYQQCHEYLRQVLLYLLFQKPPQMEEEQHPLLAHSQHLALPLRLPLTWLPQNRFH